MSTDNKNKGEITKFYLPKGENKIRIYPAFPVVDYISMFEYRPVNHHLIDEYDDRLKQIKDIYRVAKLEDADRSYHRNEIIEWAERLPLSTISIYKRNETF